MRRQNQGQLFRNYSDDEDDDNDNGNDGCELMMIMMMAMAEEGLLCGNSVGCNVGESDGHDDEDEDDYYVQW